MSAFLFHAQSAFIIIIQIPVSIAASFILLQAFGISSNIMSITGIALAMVGSYLQQRHVGIHPVYFNHNALYHLLQAVALLLVFCTAQRLIGPSSSPKG